MSKADDHAISARKVTKVYGEQTVVCALDIDVRAGECWGLLGPNGAGKTTFLRMLVGKSEPTSGTIRVLDYAIPRQAKRMRAHIGLVPQHDNLDPDFTVRENLRIYARFFGLSGTVVERRIDELLEFAGLAAKAQAPIATLSGGMKRRLTLGRALVNRPRLLILDEPTTGLDPQARQLIWQRLRRLKHEGMTLVLTTHYMDEAQRLCDRVTVMDHGRILDTEPPGAFVRKYIEPQVIEVHGRGLDPWHLDTGCALAERSEQVGETAFYYMRDERALLQALQGRPELSYLHRPANLEDVFLKLTGRDLRDA